ncbi:uncharacterized protein LOC110973037 isoform X2 [Acanthaster planci]|uniref:Uncharacterized protein LOC110973037 isoform X2 n=1 Tax=Acanthaster planci TaxID=133434 RepID=A0A8B7XFW5_ACAPL|nr:uncharacterized protein LOC110973037 isoform X2 [Acanthaster planci]
MGRKLNLSHLSEGECRQILDVIQRDYSIRQKEKARLTELQKLVKDEEQKRLVMSRQKQFNGKYCICCFSSFGLIFNKRTKCKSCGFFVCRDCSVKVEGEKDMICLGCSQQRELQVQVCEWFYGQIRNRFRRFGSAKVVRSLYKRDSQSSDSVDHSSSADSGVYHQLSPPAKEMLSGEVTKAFLETLEKQTSTVTKDLLGVPYKALLENPDWFPMLKPEMMSVAVQAPDDVLSEVLDSRQALEDFVFNLPPEEEELGKTLDSDLKPARRHSGPEVVILDPEGEPLSKTPDSNRKVHFGEMPTPAKSKDNSLASSSATGPAFHILSPIEEVLSSPEIVDKCADANGESSEASSACALKDRGGIDRLSLGEEEKRGRADSSSTISPHDWDSGIHMPLCLSQDGGWEVSQNISGTDSADGSQIRDTAARLGNSLQNVKSDSVDSFASMSLASLDANDTLDSLETHYNSVQSDLNALEVTDEFVSSSSTLVENQSTNEDNDDGMNCVGIEIEQLTLSRSSSEETLKTDDEDDLDGKVGDLTMEEFLDQLSHLSLSATSESTDDLIKDAKEMRDVPDVSTPGTMETSLASSEDGRQDEIGSLYQRMKIAEESQPLLAEEEEEDLELPKNDSGNALELAAQQRHEESSKGENKKPAEGEEKHFKCTKSHHHHSSKSHVHDSAAKGKSPYKRSKSNDDFILSGRGGDGRSKSNGSKSHRRDGEPASRCTKESHHHGKHHERSPSNRFVRYDSLPLVVEVFEAEGSYHWHHHSHRDFRQFSRESDSNDSEPSNQVVSKTSRSGAKLVRAAHLSPKSSYEEDPSQSRQLSMESNTTEDTMPKSTSQSSGPTTPESRRDSQQMVGLSSEESSREEQRSPDKPLHFSPTEPSNSLQSRLSQCHPKPTSLDYPGKERNIQEAIESLQSSPPGEGPCALTVKKDEQTDSVACPLGRSARGQTGTLPGSASSSAHQSHKRMPKQLESPHHSPLTSSPELPSKAPPLQASPCTPPIQLSPGASPLTTPKGVASLRKDIQELANLTKKVSLTQEEVLHSAEEVLTSAHKMSSIQNQVQELEEVLDSLERTVIGESSSLYGSSSSENEDSVVGPQEQVVEDMQMLEEQLASSHKENAPSETNSATAVRMITTTALKLLGTTEDAMESHSANLAPATSQRETDQLPDCEGSERKAREGETAKEIGGQETGTLLSQSYSRRSSGEEEMCACSSSDGSRPSSLSLEDAVKRKDSHSQNAGGQSDRCLESQTMPHQQEKSRNPPIHGIPFLHIHPGDGHDSPPIATLMCEMDEDVRNGNDIGAAGNLYQNGDSDMLEVACKAASPCGLSEDSCDLTFGMDGDFVKDRAAERRRRKERKLRKSSGYKTSPMREQEIDLLLYHQMADLEEKVYLSAGKVFTLEERLQQLQDRVSQVDRTSPEENIVDLEDKIALTMAQVAQSENQVRAVEAQIEALQRSREAAIDGQFNTVSVAMCDLSSPEMVSPYAFRYGSSVQIQIPRERVDTPVDFVMEVPLSAHEYNNNKEWSSEVVSKEVELEMGVTREEGGQEMTAVNGGQTAPFGVDRCAVSMELRPIQAVIVRYLQEGDDASLWPDFRFHQKRPKLDADVSHSHHGSEPEKGTERHISTLKLALGYPDHRATNPCPDKPAVSTLDEKPKGSVSVRVNEIEQLLQL